MPQIMGMVSQGPTISELMASAGFLHVWPLRETSGTTAVDIGSSPINGTYLNDFTLYGNLGVELLGDGTYSGAVSMPSTSFSVVGSTDEWTVMGVFKPTTSPTNYSVFSCADASGWSQPIQMDYRSSGSLRLRFGTGGGSESVVHDTTEVLTVSEYNHIAVTCHRIDGSTLRVKTFINGISYDDNGHVYGRSFASRDGHVGSRNATAGQVASTGYYRDWGIADYPLTEAEVNAFYGCMDG